MGVGRSFVNYTIGRKDYALKPAFFNEPFEIAIDGGLVQRGYLFTGQRKHLVNR